MKRELTNSNNISRRLLQTHETRTRRAIPATKISIIRSDGVKFASVVPLVEFDTQIFGLKNVHIPSLPPKFRIVCATGIHAHGISECLEIVSNLPPPLKFAVCAPCAQMLSAAKHGAILIFSLQSNEQTFATYIFKNMYAHHEDTDGSAISLVASLCNGVTAPIFYAGFLNALGAAARLGGDKTQAGRRTPFKTLAIDILGDNFRIMEEWSKNHRASAVGSAAYYVYNFVHPNMPLSAKECFVAV